MQHKYFICPMVPVSIPLKGVTANHPLIETLGITGLQTSVASGRGKGWCWVYAIADDLSLADSHSDCHELSDVSVVAEDKRSVVAQSKLIRLDKRNASARGKITSFLAQQGIRGTKSSDLLSSISESVCFNLVGDADFKKFGVN